MPFLQNSIAQHQNAQTSGAWSLQKTSGLRHKLVFPKEALPQILNGVDGLLRGEMLDVYRLGEAEKRRM